MLDTLLSSLDKYHRSGSRIVLALSGGVDSRVLLDLLARYKTQSPDAECIAVHVHHGLSDNADLWTEQCNQWCQESGIEFFVEYVDLHLANQISTEQEARNQRYRVLKKYISQGDVLLTGQHSHDQLETFLLAMKRGSGPKGLASMPESAPFSNGFLVRPFLQVSRASIVEYARSNQLEWIEDESNQDIQFDRNFLRHEVIPKLKERWPSIEKSVIRSSKLCADQESLIEELLHERLMNFTDDNQGLSITELSRQSTLVRNQLIRHWLNAQQCIMPSLAQLTLIWDEVALAKADANPIINTTSGQIRRFKNKLYFVGKLDDVTSWSETLTNEEVLVLPDELGCVQFISAREDETLTLRAPKTGERVWVHFNPQGLTVHPAERGHSRKLKKLFQEYEVPSWLRTRTPIVMYDDKPAAVLGLFVCKEFHGGDCEIRWDKV